MMIGKRLILEQGRCRGKTELDMGIPCNADSHYPPAGILRLQKSPAYAGLFSAQKGRMVQLPSLLARFQLISSPIVELVLDTGCL